MRISAVISNGSKCVVNKALPKSATLPKTPAAPTGPTVDAVWTAPAGTPGADDIGYTRNPSDASTTTAAGIAALGIRFGPAVNGATPLLSSAITKTNSTKIAPE